MATIDSLSPESETHDEHGQDHEHEHPEWLAHHFETPEQQFDSGKLGIWLFLTTEILLFSGMFCAYAMFRMLRPEIFEGSSEFLDTKLGAINTGVLLFSSLTMAWAVRCAQVEEYKRLVVMLATTACCAMVFLGVKTIEYSHKWAMGLLPPRWYFYSEANPHPTEQQIVDVHGYSESAAYFLTHGLYYLCAPFAVILVGLLIWAAYAFINDKKFQFACAKPIIAVCLSFFGGVGLGTIIVGSDSVEHTVAHAKHADTGDAHAVVVAETDEDPASPGAVAFAGSDAAVELLAESDLNTGAKAMLEARRKQTEMATGQVVADGAQADMGIHKVEQDVHSKRQAGVFFGIYYCMTGVHAVHILIGIGVILWLLVRAIRLDFNRQYFGPVDYVGLYWHLVDLIWIYLFPLLYLIR